MMTVCKVYDLFKVGTLKTIYEIIRLRGKALEVLAKVQDFDFALVTVVSGSCFLSVKRDLAGLHHCKTIYPFCYPGIDPQH